MKRITLSDIAKACGVSVNTVSHALHDKPDISEQTRELIRKTAKELGYIRNASASFLRSGVSKNIAVIVGDISNPHFSILIKEVEQTAGKQGYTSFIFNTDENEKLEREAIITSISKNADGIIICPVQKSDMNLLFLKESGVPFTLIGRRSSIETNYVVCDDKNSGYLAANYILEGKNKKTAILNGSLYISSARERLEGIRNCYQDHGLEIGPKDVYELPVSGWQNGAKMKKILEKDYDSAICFSDLIALELLSCQEECGKKLTIVSFDNIQSRFHIPFRFPSITSSKAKMGHKAVEVLISAIEGNTQPMQIVLPTGLRR